ncbi:MAG TPA: hypothetical protein PKJ45_06530, partial [Rubrivivax sp.]|nr:hypothetical protein [Rubrivivax sp.]
MEFAPAATATDAVTAAATSPSAADIHIELTRGGTQLSVRWPSTEATSCVTWLRVRSRMITYCRIAILCFLG